jgi:hypothetical protein
MGKKSIEVHGLNQLNAALRERTFSTYDGLRRKFYLTEILGFHTAVALN